jgi:hypothetical protein
MTFLFIGGNADGEVLEVTPGMTAWHVRDKIVPSLAVHEPSKEPRGSCLYTKRTYRRGSWTIVHYFAAADLSDEEALKRLIEFNR